MDVSVRTPPPTGGVNPSLLTQEQATEYHEFFRIGVTRDVVLLSSLEEQWVHHLEGKKRRLCTAHIGRCQFCEQAPFTDTVEPRQRESVAATLMRSARGKEYVQKVAVFPRAASEELRKLCGDLFRGRIFSIERGKSNRLKLRAVGHWQYTTSLPASFPVLPFVLARFGLRQDPNVPLVLLPTILVEEQRTAPGDLPHIGINAANALDAEDLAKGREMLRVFVANGFVRPGEEPSPAAAGDTSSQVLNDTSPAAANDASNSATEMSRAAADDASPEIAATAVKPRGSMTPDPERVTESLHRRMALHKPAEELTPVEAVQSGRIVDYVAAGLKTPPGVNGKHHANGKGGVK